MGAGKERPKGRGAAGKSFQSLGYPNAGPIFQVTQKGSAWILTFVAKNGFLNAHTMLIRAQVSHPGNKRSMGRHARSPHFDQSFTCFSPDSLNKPRAYSLHPQNCPCTFSLPNATRTIYSTISVTPRIQMQAGSIPFVQISDTP